MPFFFLHNFNKTNKHVILVDVSNKKMVERSDLTNTNIKPESAKTWRPLKKFKISRRPPSVQRHRKTQNSSNPSFPLPSALLSLSHPLPLPLPLCVSRSGDVRIEPVKRRVSHFRQVRLYLIENHPLIFQVFPKQISSLSVFFHLLDALKLLSIFSLLT